MSKSLAIKEIAAPDYLSKIWQHLTPEVCTEVFELTRDRERQRKWGLHALLKTWIGILQCDLGSQTEAIEEYCGQSHPLFPLVEASPESFFKRLQALRRASSSKSDQIIEENVGSAKGVKLGRPIGKYQELQKF